MPYSGFEYRRPFGSFISGLGAADELQMSGLKRSMMQDAMQQRQEERAALKTFAGGGGDRDLMAASPDTWLKMTKAQREMASGAMQEFREQAPFLTPENYGEWREGFYKSYPTFNRALLPPPEVMKSPDAIKAFVTKGAALANELDRQKMAGQVEEQVKGQEQLFHKVQKPMAQLQQDFKKTLVGIEFGNRQELQKSDQEFHGKWNQKKLDMDEQLKEAKTTEGREQHFYGNLRQERQSLHALQLKQIQKIDDMDLPPAEREEKVAQLNEYYGNIWNEIQGDYENWAKRYNIPFKVGSVPSPGKPSAGAAPGGTRKSAVDPKALEELKRRGLVK